jgi:hypothetical protein
MLLELIDSRQKKPLIRLPPCKHQISRLSQSVRRHALQYDNVSLIPRTTRKPIQIRTRLMANSVQPYVHSTRPLRTLVTLGSPRRAHAVRARKCVREVSCGREGDCKVRGWGVASSRRMRNMRVSFECRVGLTSGTSTQSWGETGSDTALLDVYDISKGHSRVVFKYKTKYLKE